jgi:hypothetical protein
MADEHPSPQQDQRARPTHEWQRIETLDEAEAIGREARQRKTESQCRKTPRFSDGNRHRNQKFSVMETVTTVKVRKPSLLSISRVGVGDAAPPSTTTTDVKPARENFSRKRKP